MVDASVYANILKEILAELDKQGIDFHSAEAQTVAACAILGEMSKDRRMAVIGEERKVTPTPGKNVKPWRDEPATPDQLSFLKRHSILHDPKITKGPASDLIEERVRKWQGK